MKYWILLCAVFALSAVSRVFGSCASDVNGCTTTFQLKLYNDRSTVCPSLNDFVKCTYKVLQPCSIDTRTLLQTGIQFLITQYTQPPSNCVIDDATNYTVDQCTEEISYCAAYNFNGLASTDNITLACRYFHIYLNCMSTNTSSCGEQEDLEIQVAIQNSVRKFRQCPYGCDTSIKCETQAPAVTVTSATPTSILSLTSSTAESTSTPSTTTEEVTTPTLTEQTTLPTTKPAIFTTRANQVTKQTTIPTAIYGNNGTGRDHFSGWMVVMWTLVMFSGIM